MYPNLNGGPYGNQGYNGQGFNNQGYNSQGFNNQGYNNQSHHGHHHHHHGHHGHHGHHDHTTFLVVKTEQGFNNNPYPQPASLFNPNQQYIFVSQLDDNYALDVSQDKANYGQLIIWKRHNKKNQRFKMIQHNGRYYIVSSASNNVISVQNNSHNDGQILFTNQGNGLFGQLWQFEFSTKKQNRFHIKNGNGKYLDVFEAKAKKGQRIIQWSYNGNKNQTWHLVPV